MRNVISATPDSSVPSAKSAALPPSPMVLLKWLPGCAIRKESCFIVRLWLPKSLLKSVQKVWIGFDHDFKKNSYLALVVLDWSSDLLKWSIDPTVSTREGCQKGKHLFTAKSRRRQGLFAKIKLMKRGADFLKRSNCVQLLPPTICSGEIWKRTLLVCRCGVSEFATGMHTPRRPAPPRPGPENFQDCPAPPHSENAPSLTVTPPRPEEWW